MYFNIQFHYMDAKIQPFLIKYLDFNIKYKGNFNNVLKPNQIYVYVILIIKYTQVQTFNNVILRKVLFHKTFQ
jgi:hypothetical protein